MKSYLPHKKKVILYWILYIFLLGCYFSLFVVLKLPTSLQHTRIDNVTSLKERDIGHFVEYTFDHLTYTGINFLRDGTVIGGYYYYDCRDALDEVTGNRYMLVLVSGEQPAATLTQYTARFRVLGEANISGVLGQLADHTKIAYQDLSPLFTDILLSEPDYPTSAIRMITIVTTFITILLIGMLIHLLSITPFRRKKLP